MNSDDPAIRYRARLEELASLKAELEAPKRPGDPAPVIGRVLEAAGDLLRRAQALQCDVAAVEAVISLVAPAALASWKDGVDVSQLRARLARSTDEAVEAGVPDTPEDGGTWASWAMQGLFARDRFESALCAIERLAKQGRADANALHAQLTQEVAAVDRALRHRALWLTPLNAARRSEAALLDASLRATAWWFTECSEPANDAVVPHLDDDRHLDPDRFRGHRRWSVWRDQRRLRLLPDHGRRGGRRDFRRDRRRRFRQHAGFDRRRL